MDFDMVVVECPRCHARFHSWDEQDVLDKYNKHKCLTDDKRLQQILDRILVEYHSISKAKA